MQFKNFKDEKEKWITFIESDFYPNYLDEAKKRYSPFLQRFNELLKTAQTSQELFLLISDESGKERIQLLRIFRRFVSPDTSVEMLKVKKKSQTIIREFGSRFRPIEEVRKRFNVKNNVLIAVLREYDDRGIKGYDVSSAFFDWFRKNFKDDLTIDGPTRAGKDIYLDDVFDDYPGSRPVDFVIKYKKNPIVVGFIRYDSDRGGSQEDDRTGGYKNVIYELVDYAERRNLNFKILFVNEGPGLTLGSMWKDYSNLEDIGKGQVRVVTLKMLDDRVTKQWLLS